MRKRLEKLTSFGPDITIRPYCDGYKVDYGFNRGWEVFETHEDMTASLIPWTTQELSILLKKAEGIAKLQRYIQATKYG